MYDDDLEPVLKAVPLLWVRQLIDNCLTLLLIE